LVEIIKNQARAQFTQEPYHVDEAIEYAIKAIERGEINLGTAALEWVLDREPKNQLAWLWMACTVVDEKAKRECYIKASA